MPRGFASPIRLVLPALCLALWSAPGDAAPTAPRPLPADPPERFAALAVRLLRGPSAPTALAELYALQRTAEFLPAAVAAHWPVTLGRLADARQTPALLRDHARMLLAHDALVRGTPDERTRATGEFAALGYPPHWALVGPFDNLGNRAFAEELGPEVDNFAGIRAEQGYDAAGRPVRWRFLPGLGRFGPIDLTPLFEGIGDAPMAAYLATVVVSPNPQAAALRVGSADSVQVWLSGRQVLSHDVRRRAFPDQDRVTVLLPAGASLLVVKLCRQRSDWQLSLRLTAPAGGPLRGLSFPAERQAWDVPLLRSAAPLTEPEEPEPLAGLRRALAAKGVARAALTDDVALAQLAVLFHRDDEPGGALVQSLEALAARAPERAEVLALLARALGDDADRRRQVNERAARLASRAGQADPDVLAALVAQRLRGRDLERAFDQAARLARVAPGHPLPAVVQAFRVGTRGFPRVAVRDLRALAERYPRFDLPLRLAATFAGGAGDQATLRDILRAEIERAGDDVGLHLRYAEALARRDGPLGAAKHVEDVIATRPADWRLYARLARLLAAADRPDAALQALDRGLALFGPGPTLLALRGDVGLRLGDLDGARSAFEGSLTLKPQQPDLRLRLARLTAAASATPGDTDAPTQADAPPRLPVPNAACKEAGACYLRVATAVDVQPNGLRSVVRETYVQVLDRRMRDAFRQVVQSYVPEENRLEVLVAERLSPDGRRHRPTAVRDERPRDKRSGVYGDEAYRTLAFDDLAEGDVLHVRLRTDDIGERNLFGDFFGHIEPFQTLVPILEARLDIRLRGGRTLVTFEQGVAAPTVTRDGDITHYAWLARDLAALAGEPNMPGYPEVGAFVNVSTFSSWDELGRWWADLVRDQWATSGQIRERTAALVAGAADVRERVRRIYNFVVRHTRYVGIEFGIHGFKPYKVTQTFERGYGDCKDKAFLLAAMLGEAGVEAHPVLVRTRNLGRLPDTPATLWAFNHAIVHVPALDLWLDATNEFAGMTELHPHDQGAMGLVVRRDGTVQRLTLPETGPADNHWKTQVVVQLSAQGDATLEIAEQAVGVPASSLRRTLADPTRRAQTLERMLSDALPGLRILNERVSDLTDIDQPVTVQLQAEVPRLGRLETDGTLAVRVAPVPNDLAEGLGGSARRFDYLFEHAWQEDTQVRYVLPAGFEPSTLPDDVVVEHPFGRYEQRVTRVGADVLVQTRIVLATRRVPAARYAELRSFAARVTSLERRDLTLTRRPADAPPPAREP